MDSHAHPENRKSRMMVFFQTPRGRTAVNMLIVLVAVFLVYRPVLDAGFVWDDLLNFQHRAWLYHGDLWKQYIFTGFNDWQLYFRPLVVALFVLQARLFDGAPEPMHAVTLGMQLINVALVMVLAQRTMREAGKRNLLLVALAGLMFGLHPMLVETVVWIGCQFDQMQVMFALLGLLFNFYIRKRWPRAIIVAACFFLSACSKESAAAYPAIVMIFDWLFRGARHATLMDRARLLMRENWPSYIMLLIAGVAYLCLRKIMMGSVASDVTLPMLIPDGARVEEIAYVYLKYWSVIAGVPLELNPLHPVENYSFGTSTSTLLLRLVPALALAAAGLLVLTQRFCFTGAWVTIVGLYLFPVLGFFPGHFDGSLYHERYAVGAIALTAVLLPSVLHEWACLLQPGAGLRRVVMILALAWLAWAVASVRVTLPLWSNDLALWRWASSAHPQSSLAAGNLISAEINAGNLQSAYRRVREALDQNLDCDYCYLNGFDLAVTIGDLSLANATKQRVRESREFMRDRSMTQTYWRIAGFLEMRLGNPNEAEQMLRESLKLEDSESLSHLLLAETLVALGQLDEARDEAERAVQLAPPLDQNEVQHMVEFILAGNVMYGQPMQPAEPAADN
ncbi:tetratricopeptide repeat protein [Denitratimonas sp. CY0512]|uniref:tetratricopeptide repeat protein n=1 Tax=Denitratimonas sp. CY0512 TaxID=3131940 RepID=UPI0030B6119F